MNNEDRLVPLNGSRVPAQRGFFGAILVGLLVVTSVIGLVVLNTIIDGLVLSILWRWFVAPAFGLKPIGVATAIGLTLVVGLFHDINPKKDESSGGWTNAAALLAARWLSRALALGLGWIVLQFVQSM